MTYQVGDIVAGITSGTPLVIVHVAGCDVVGFTLRDGWLNKGRRKAGHRVDLTNWTLQPFTGTLTDEEEALAMKHLLLGVNG